VALRKAQQKERVRLQAEILQSQKSIAELNDARAPVAAEVRKVEAEVGPIKYIAALIYGDNPDQNVLERAVRWVIILIVIVFDPLALCLILASNKQLEWVREDRDKPEEPAPVYVADVVEPPTAEEAAYELDDGPISEEILDTLRELAKEELPTGKLIETSSLFDEQLTCYRCGTVLVDAAGIGPFCPNKECDVVDNWDTEELPHDPHPTGWMYDKLQSHPILADEAEKEFDLADYPYLNNPGSHFVDLKPMVAQIEEPVIEAVAEPEPALTEEQQMFLDQAPALIEELSHELDAKQEQIELLQNDYNQLEQNSRASLTRNFELTQQIEQLRADMAEVEASRNVELQRANNLSAQLMEVLHPVAPPMPDLSVTADNTVALKEKPNSSFGIEFPSGANKGDLFLRTDYLPTKLFKFNGDRWFELDKTNTDSYAYNESYLEFLVEKLRSGEYDRDDLSDVEHEQIAQYLQGKNGIQ
jgi:hypothetical protein